MSISPGDIRGQTKSEVMQNHAKFSMFLPPPQIFRGRPQIFLSGIVKLNILLTMWQNFTAIGPMDLGDLVLKQQKN